MKPLAVRTAAALVVIGLVLAVPEPGRGATEWIKLPPSQVVEQAQLVAVGRFDPAPSGEGSVVVAHGLVWQLVPFTVDYYVRSPGVMQRLAVGVEPDRAAGLAGRRHLLLLEQRQGEWLALGGPNGLVPLEGDEPALASEQDRAYYRRFLAENRHYPPMGRGQAPRSAAASTGLAAVWLAMIFILLVMVRRRRRAG